MSGYITASNSVQTDTIDTLSATALNIGTSSATSINIGKSSIAVKSSNILMSANKIDSATGNGVLSIGTVNGSTTLTDIAIFIGKNTNTTRVQGRLQATYIDGLSSGGGTNDLYLQANSTNAVRVGATSGCLFDDGGATITGLSIYDLNGAPTIEADSNTIQIGTDITNSIVMGKTIPSFPVTINSNGAYPLKTNALDTINSGDTLTIGGNLAGQINVGSGNNTVIVGGAFYIYNNIATYDAFLDLASPVPASINIGTNINVTPTVINIGQTGVTTTVKDNLTITNGTNTITFNTGTGSQLLLGGSAGTAGQVLVSGGASGNLTWASGGFYVTGSIATPNATTRTLQAFGYTFTTTNPPKVYLTYDAGSSSTSILTTCVAGIDGSAGAWTGFYFLTSTAGASGSQLNWLASN